MTGKTRIFWLLSDNKTVREVTRDETFKRGLLRDRYHLVYIHGDSEFYTTKKWLPFIQFNQCIKHLAKVE